MVCLIELMKLIWPKSADMYRIAAEKIVQFTEEIKTSFGITIKYLDLGGGFLSPDFLDPYIDAFVEPILDGLKHDLPILILEPGRAIVKNAIDLITTVVGVREFPEGKRRIVVDAGINLLPTGFCP